MSSRSAGARPGRARRSAMRSLIALKSCRVSTLSEFSRLALMLLLAHET